MLGLRCWDRSWATTADFKCPTAAVFDASFNQRQGVGVYDTTSRSLSFLKSRASKPKKKSFLNGVRVAWRALPSSSVILTSDTEVHTHSKVMVEMPLHWQSLGGGCVFGRQLAHAEDRAPLEITVLYCDLSSHSALRVYTYAR
jgi:hypothetical protein